MWQGEIVNQSELIYRIQTAPKYSDYLELHSALTAGALAIPLGARKLRVSIQANFLMSPMIPVLASQAFLRGICLEIQEGDFDVGSVQAIDPKSAMYQFNPEIFIYGYWLEAIAPRLVHSSLTLSESELLDQIEFVQNRIRGDILAIRNRSMAPIFVNNFPKTGRSALGIIDSEKNLKSQTSILDRLNSFLSDFCSSQSDVYIINFEQVVSRFGSAQALDRRYWHMARAPLAQSALSSFATEYVANMASLVGKSKKCLILDCDNTLWGGVVGEDGLSGIKLGNTFPGSCFREFQETILNLQARGIILALCSKNNEADVLDVLRKHPDCLIKERHLAAWQINWDDKATNIRRIAQELNIGTDSLVFVDDSSFECDWVRKEVPEVTVIQLPKSTAGYSDLLLNSGLFDSLTFSKEDSDRNQLYVVERQRKELEKSASSMEDYLRSLELQAEISRVDDRDIARVSQLTQKTNQYNLTTRRYTESDIKRFASSDQWSVFTLKLRDKMSDMGLVAVAIVDKAGQQARIDSLLMSCRVIGRGVEEALLYHVAREAAKNGARQLYGEFIPTEKNSQVAEFFQNHGFKEFPLNDKETKGTAWIIEDLETFVETLSPATWIKMHTEKDIVNE